MNRIDEDIKNRQFKSVYLLYGDQAYLRNQYRDKLKNALCDATDTMNLAYYSGSGVPIKEVMELADTMPFLAEKRVIIIEDSGLFKSSCDELADYIASVPETTCIVFSEESVDKRLKLYKAVREVGVITELTNLSSEELQQWVLTRITKEHRRITGRAMEIFLQRAGDDMMNIVGELEKLLAYTYGKDGIFPEDVMAVCTPRIEDRIFELLDAIVAGDRDKALKLYGDLYALKEAPARILFMIVRQLRILLHIKEMQEEHKNADDMARVLALKPYAVKKTLPQAGRRSKAWIEKALELCAKTDEDSKNGRMDAQMGLEVLIVRLSA